MKLPWVVTLVVGERWSPSDGDNGDVESDEKSWWPQNAGSTPATVWAGIDIAETGV